MNIGRTLAVLAGAGFAVLATWLLVARELPQSPTATATQPADDTRAVAAPEQATSGQSPVASAVLGPLLAQAAGPSQRMRQEFSEATDLRAFAYAAMARPQEGGYFYARHAANLCGQDVGQIKRWGDEVVANELRETGTVALARLQSAEQIQRLCGSFTAGEARELFKQMNAKAASGADPLLSAREDVIGTLLRKKQWGQAAALFERLARLDDPLLWTEDQLFRLIVSSDAETRKRGGFYFDGRVYGPEENGAAESWAALELGFCGKGPCGAIDLRSICLGGGFCGDHTTLVKSQYFAGGGTDEGWRRVLLLEQRVRAGIESGSTPMFVQPRR